MGRDHHQKQRLLPFLLAAPETLQVGGRLSGFLQIA